MTNRRVPQVHRQLPQSTAPAPRRRFRGSVGRLVHNVAMSPRFIAPSSIEKMAADMLAGEPALVQESEAIDIERFAERLGCEISYVEFSDPRVSARVSPNDDPARPYSIEINANDSYFRRRFSIAHELAHVVLHQEDSRVDWRKPLGAYADKDELYKEVQANMLASSLLIPAERAREAWEDCADVDDFARRFKVSRDAAYWRLNNLDLLSHD
jgi:Zn-dependent peptidase ImmA (M78 family)